MTDERTATITIHVLVSDQVVRVLEDHGDAADNRRAWADAIRDEVLYGGCFDATRLEIRKLSLQVPLLTPAVAHDATPHGVAPIAVEVPPELTQAVEEIMRRRTLDNREQAQRIIMESLPPGIWEFYQEGNSRGIRRIDAPVDRV